MKEFQTSFDFPSAKDLNLLKGIKTVKQLKEILYNLRNSSEYYPHYITYSAKQWKPVTDQSRHNFSLYFNCCVVANQPSLHFTSYNGDVFQIDGRSKFTHNHFTKPKKRLYRNRKGQIIEKNISDLEEMHEQEIFLKNCGNKMIQEYPIKDEQISDEQLSSELSDSWQAKQKIQRKGGYKVQKVFDFPTLKLLQSISTTRSIRDLSKKISNFIRIKCYEFRGILHHGSMYCEQDQNGGKANFMKIQFKCCRVENEKIPFLLYKEKQSGQFHLLDYNIRHDHRDGRGRKKNSEKSKYVDLIKSEVKKQNHSQSKVFIHSNHSFVDIISIDDESIINFKENSQNFFYTGAKSEQKQLSQQKLKQQGNQMIDEKNFLQNKQMDAQNSFFQKSSKLQQQLGKMDKRIATEKSSDFLSFFQRKKQVQKEVIQISSQSEPELENQNQNQNKNLKLPNIKKISSTTQNSLILKDKKKRQQKDILEIQQKYSIEQKQSQIQLKNKLKIIENQKKLSIYSWLQSYNDEITKFISFKPSNRKLLKDDLKSQMKKNFQNYFPSALKQQLKQTKRTLKQCIFKMLLWNKIETLQLSNLRRSQQIKNPFQIQNRIFLKKIRDKKKVFQNQNRDSKSQNVKIFLAVYPIKMAKNSEELKVFIAYTLTYDFFPNLIWFHVFGKSSKNLVPENFSTQDLERIIFFEVLFEGIKYYGLKKVNFICTILDCQLMDALDKICQTKSNSKLHYSYSMHFSCINSIFHIETVPQNSQMIQQISEKIKNCKNTAQVKASCKILKSVFNKNIMIQSDQCQQTNNPRVIYQNYKVFAQIFESIKSESDSDISKAGLVLFSSELLCNQREKTLIWDHVSQLNQFFADYNEFNHIGEFFPFILRYFDTSLRKSIQIATATLIVPSSLIQVQNQCRNFRSLCKQNQKLLFPIEQIFSYPTLEMVQILSKCPRFIIQTIYKLIIAANQLALKNQNKSQLLDKTVFIYKGNTKSQRFLVIPVENNNLQRLQMKQDVQQRQQMGKKWTCSCNFYKLTGIPCEHEILTILQNKDSLLKQIHPCWKNKYVSEIN